MSVSDKIKVDSIFRGMEFRKSPYASIADHRCGLTDSELTVLVSGGGVWSAWTHTRPLASTTGMPLVLVAKSVTVPVSGRSRTGQLDECLILHFEVSYSASKSIPPLSTSRTSTSHATAHNNKSTKTKTSRRDRHTRMCHGGAGCSEEQGDTSDWGHCMPSIQPNHWPSDTGWARGLGKSRVLLQRPVPSSMTRMNTICIGHWRSA